jgi:CRP-like cAMP-binding protein
MPEPPPLREVPLFASLDETMLQRLAHDAKVECYESGDVIFRQGDRTTSIVIVLNGFVKLLRIAPCGDETLVDICCNGQSVNEALTLGGDFYHVSAEAVGATRVLKLSAARFAHLLRESPTLAIAVIREATNKICKLFSEIESLKAQSADKRLACFILALCPLGEDRCQFRLPYDKRLIAARLGIQQETLSRAFAKLRDYGVRTETRLVFVDSVTRLAAAYNDMEPARHLLANPRPRQNEAHDAAAQ